MNRVDPPDHVFVTTGGPFYGPWDTLDLEGARQAFDERIATMLYVARYAAPRMYSGGSITFMGGTGSRHVAPGLGITGAMNVAADALTRQLAVEVTPVRVNLIAAGFVDTEMSARLLGDALDSRRVALRDTLPIRRVVQAEDVADFALYLMAQTAATGTTFDLDGGQSLL